MKIKGYLTVNSRGAMRITKTQPALDWNEISILVGLELPDALFRKPMLQASIVLPEEVAMKDPITAEVVDNVAEAIKQNTGLEFNIKVIKEEQNDAN